MRLKFMDYVIDINLVLEGRCRKDDQKLCGRNTPSPLDAKIYYENNQSIAGETFFKPHVVCDGIESQLQTEGAT